jgi:hypothetical protein
VRATHKVRVNYYVRELYGDPDAFHDAWAAPFGVLAMMAPTAIFVHPVVEKVKITAQHVMLPATSQLALAACRVVLLIPIGGTRISIICEPEIAGNQARGSPGSDDRWSAMLG